MGKVFYFMSNPQAISGHMLFRGHLDAAVGQVVEKVCAVKPSATQNISRHIQNVVTALFRNPEFERAVCTVVEDNVTTFVRTLRRVAEEPQNAKTAVESLSQDLLPAFSAAAAFIGKKFDVDGAVEKQEVSALDQLDEASMSSLPPLAGDLQKQFAAAAVDVVRARFQGGRASHNALLADVRTQAAKLKEKKFFLDAVTTHVTHGVQQLRTNLQRVLSAHKPSETQEALIRMQPALLQALGKMAYLIDGSKFDKAKAAPEKPVEVVHTAADKQRALSMRVIEVDLPMRIWSVLSDLKLDTLADVCNKTDEDFLMARGFGVGSLETLRAKLAELGLKLKGE